MDGMDSIRIALISTGGTIEKTYDELSGVLANQVSVLEVMLGQIVLGDVELVRVPLMNKDSMDMTEHDHTLIAQTAGNLGQVHHGVVVIHGTDRLVETGNRMVELLGTPHAPIVLTGAMRPYALRNTDALQNLTGALLAVQFVEPGIYMSMHNRVLAFPGVMKDRERGTFVMVEEGEESHEP